MNYLAQVQAGVDYIEARLDEDIELADVARAAGISRWHFQRIFKALTNETLKTYIRSRRLASSLDKLLHTDARIIDIAMCAGYESQESFARAFKKAFGMPPSEYRKLGDKSLFLRKVQFDSAYLRHINTNVSLEPEIVEQPAMRLVGLRTQFYSVDSEKNNIGEQLPPLWESFVARLQEVPHAVPGVAYGVVQQSDDNAELLEYHAAIEVRDVSTLPPGMVVVDVPEATYASFTHRGNPRDIDRTVNYIYSTWLSQSGRHHTYAADLEIYGADYVMDSDDSVMQYAIPVG
jgi:AraC family transcriptional regulator